MKSENSKDVTAGRLDPAGFPHQTPGRSPPATIENIAHLLSECGIHARFNVIKKRLELRRSDGSRISTTAIASLATLNGLSTGWLPQFIEEIGYTHSFNPVRDWILSEPWDQKERLTDLCETLFEAEDYPRELKEILIKRWLLSATKAALADGRFHARGVLTLQGPQGIGKTSWIRSLMPPGELRNDCILLDHHMDGSNKDSIINAVTHWIVEIGELDSSFKKDVARLKGFLTNDCDKLRRPYGKEVAEYPRRTIFAASVNEDRFLVDQTGNTRFWTVSLRGIRHQHDIDMQQVFAQVAALLETGEQWWLTGREDQQLADYNRRHQSVSVVAELIADCINIDCDWEPPYRTAMQVLKQAGLERPTNAQCREAGSLLRDRFGPPKRVQGREQWRVSFQGEEPSEKRAAGPAF